MGRQRGENDEIGKDDVEVAAAIAGYNTGSAAADLGGAAGLAVGVGATAVPVAALAIGAAAFLGWKAIKAIKKKTQ